MSHGEVLRDNADRLPGASDCCYLGCGGPAGFCECVPLRFCGWPRLRLTRVRETREKDVEVKELKAKVNLLEQTIRAVSEQLLGLSKKQWRDESLAAEVYRDVAADTREQAGFGIEQQSSIRPSRRPLGDLSTNEIARPRRTTKEVPEKPLVDWEQEHARIFKRLEASKKSEEQYKKVATDWRKRTTEWQKYADTLGAKVEELEKQTSAARPPVTETRTAETGGDTREARSDDNLELPVRRPAHRLSFSLDLDSNRSFADREVDVGTASTRHNSANPVTSVLKPAGEIAVGPEPHQSTERDTPPDTHRDHAEDSDQETCDGSEDNASLPLVPAVTNEDAPIAIKSESSSEGVSFVSEKRLKRKRAADDGNVAPRRRLKSESNSDLQTLGQVVRFNPQENIDLGSDSRQDQMLTPRINRFREDAMPGPGLSAITDAPGPLEVNSPNRHTPSRIQDDRVDEPLMLFDSGRTAVSKSPTEEPSARHRIKPSRRKGEQFNHRVSKLNRAVEELAEDGHSGPGSSFHSLETIELSTPAPEPKTPGILASLLNNPPPAGPPPPRRRHRANHARREVFTPPLGEPPIVSRAEGDGHDSHAPGDSSIMRRAEGDRHDLTTPDDQHTGDTTATSGRRVQAGISPKCPVGTVFRTSFGSVSGKPKTRPGQSPTTPLRQRPVSSLTLADFKINPKANEGRSFAYSEVVRGKAARASLDGCTEYNCCGRFFSQMARNEFEAGGPSLLLQPASIKLLEDYLGDDAHRLGSMNRPEKEELWIEAKMRQQAKRYGRHRDKGPGTRRPTPPGFRDHDMPTTQETEAHKREAKKQEKALVEERRKEALRPGGRWLFRDEQ